MLTIPQQLRITLSYAINMQLFMFLVFPMAPCNFMLSIVQRQPVVSSLRHKHFEDLHVIISVFNVLWFYSVMLLRVLSQHLPDRVSSCKACVKCFSLH